MNARKNNSLSLLHELIWQFCCAWGMKQKSCKGVVVSKIYDCKGCADIGLLGLQLDVKDHPKKYNCREFIKYGEGILFRLKLGEKILFSCSAIYMWCYSGLCDSSIITDILCFAVAYYFFLPLAYKENACVYVKGVRISLCSHLYLKMIYSHVWLKSLTK